LEAAKYDALKLLTYRSRTRSELSKRLALKGYDDSTVEKTLAHLETIGLVDDLKWAHDRINYYLRKGYGIIGIKNVLREKGVDRQLAETALESISLEAETEAGSQFLGKKYKPPFDIKTKKRVLDALRRRGFSNESINSVLKNVQERNENSDEK
jgi:regulatory protein